MTDKLTHFNDQDRARMVDVTAKGYLPYRYGSRTNPYTATTLQQVKMAK